MKPLPKFKIGDDVIIDVPYREHHNREVLNRINHKRTKIKSLEWNGKNYGYEVFLTVKSDITDGNILIIIDEEFLSHVNEYKHQCESNLSVWNDISESL